MSSYWRSRHFVLRDISQRGKEARDIELEIASILLGD